MRNTTIKLVLTFVALVITEHNMSELNTKFRLIIDVSVRTEYMLRALHQVLNLAVVAPSNY
jgi:hypothetical protein